MPKRLNILVAGGYDTKDDQALAKPATDVMAFAKCLGEELMKQGHNLLTGCQTELDQVVAEAAWKSLGSPPLDNKEAQKRVVSYVLPTHTPVHNFGVVVRSDLTDWDLGSVKAIPPEIIRYADAIILLGGFQGTYRAANWARLSKKPILPFVIFGGAAKDVYSVEADDFEKNHAANVERLMYDQVLKSLATDWRVLATQTVTLAERLVTPPNAFVVMSFKSTVQYTKYYESVQRVCKGFDYEARRVDDSALNLSKIVVEIEKKIRQCAFVIADITEEKANVYFELGFAQGIGKEVVLTAREGTVPPFDIKDIPIVFWDGLPQFEDALKPVIAKIGSFQGRA